MGWGSNKIYTYSVMGYDDQSNSIHKRVRGVEELTDMIQEFKDKGWDLYDIEVE